MASSSPVKAALGRILEGIALVLSALSRLRLFGLAGAALVLAVSYGFLSWRHDLAVERERTYLAEMAARPPLTLAKATDLLVARPVPNRPDEVGRRLAKGTKVAWIAKDGPLAQVRVVDTGEVGLIARDAVAQYDRLVATKDNTFYLVNPAPDDDWLRRIDVPAEKRRPLPKGTRGTMIEKRKNATYKVRLDDGTVGWVDQGIRGMMPALDVESAYRSRQFVRVLAEADLRARAVGRPIADVVEDLGPPDALVIRDAKAGTGQATWGKALAIVVGSRRHEGAVADIEDGKVARVTVRPASRWVLAEALPGAAWVRSLDLSNTIFREPPYDPGPVKSDHPWYLRMLIGLATMAAALWVIGTFPQAATALPRVVIRAIPWPNGIVIALDFLLLAAATHFWFLFLAIHLDGRESMSLFLAHDLLAIVLLVGFSASWGRNLRFVRYMRCPACRSTGVAVDLGSILMQTTKAYTWHHHDTYTHTTYGRKDGRTVITKHYRRDWERREHLTDHFSDQRECARCGHTWEVERLVGR
jgi:hypothetical protein